jgi:integrase/recombinase XerD
MATIKILLRTDKKNKSNEAPLWIRITKNRKSRYVSLGKSIKIEDWDEQNNTVRKSHPNSVRLNKFIARKVADAHDTALDLETEDKYVRPIKIKEDILGISALDFFAYAKRYSAELESKGSYGTLGKADSVVKKIEKYLGRRTLSMDEITIHWLKNYETHLRGTLNNSTNTIHTNFKVIRRLINAAIREELFPYEKNPFLRYQLKWEKTTKEFLEEEELTRLIELELDTTTKLFHYRNMYIIATEAGGLRISDMLFIQKKNYDGTRIIIDTLKTGSTVSIKVPLKAKALLDEYVSDLPSPESFIFPLLNPDLNLEDKKACLLAKSRAAALINKGLRSIAKKAKIEKHIHFHTSRHTFATRALRKGMRIEYVSKLLGHASIKTTQIYAKIVNEELDKAMDVFNE